MNRHPWYHRIEASAIVTFVGIILLFSTAIGTILIAPRYIDRSWIEPTSPFQKQMYEESDPHFYIGRSSLGVDGLEYVHHLAAGRTLIAFQESEDLKIQAPPHLEKYVTRLGESPVKLTTRLLMLRPLAEGKTPKTTEKSSSKSSSEKSPNKQVMELYEVNQPEAFAIASADDLLAHYIDHDYHILDTKVMQPYHKDLGVIFVKNPQEYRFTLYQVNGDFRYRYDPHGNAIKDLAMLQGPPLGFISRKDLIRQGEDIYKAEGCWYCHTDQTRTLIQDTVLNGTETYAAPPSSPNEYIYQYTSFLGTRRIGPDLSRVGVKRPSRDWHKSHFWDPKNASLGSIMPSFRHLFTYDSREISNALEGVPNMEFEALYQYLMTKGTRMTPPDQSWWDGKDPLQTTAIIEGRPPLEPQGGNNE